MNPQRAQIIDPDDLSTPRDPFEAEAYRYLSKTSYRRLILCDRVEFELALNVISQYKSTQ